MTSGRLAVMTARVEPVPNQSNTPQRTIRISDAIWQQAKEVAERRGESLSDVIRVALIRYTRRNRL